MRTFVEASFVERPDETSLQQSRQNDHKTFRGEDKHHTAAASAATRSNVKRTPPGRAPAIRRIRSGMSFYQLHYFSKLPDRFKNTKKMLIYETETIG